MPLRRYTNRPHCQTVSIRYRIVLIPVTFFKLSLGQATILLNQGDSALSVELVQGVNLDLSTCATRSCASSIGLQIPSLAVHVLSRPESSDWETVGHAKAGASVEVYSAPQGWRDAAAKQQAFIRKEDAETCRIAYLYAGNKSARHDHFRYHVFVPTPRPPDDASSVAYSTTDEDDAPGQSEEIPSSPDSSDSEEQISSRPRRPRKLSVLRPHAPHDTKSEEDDSDLASVYSSVSSSDSDETPEVDMPSVLAEKLRAFQARRRPIIDFAQDGNDNKARRAGLPLPSSLRCGSIVKISAQPIDLVLQPDALRVVSSIIGALSQAVSLKLCHR